MTGVACPDNPIIQLLILTQNIFKILLKTTKFGFFWGGVVDQPMSGPFFRHEPPLVEDDYSSRHDQWWIL